VVFREFDNPEERDYDLKTSMKNAIEDENNKYIIELTNLIGILEDIDEEELFNKYGITLHEYFYPDQEVIDKVKFALNNSFQK